jgi:hypothetical protein
MERSGRGNRIYPPRLRLSICTVGSAQSQAFPGARFEQIQPRIWKALAGDKLIGYFFLDHVIGKHLYIDYSVALSADGRIRRVEILTYRNPMAMRSQMRAGFRNLWARTAPAHFP